MSETNETSNPGNGHEQKPPRKPLAIAAAVGVLLGAATAFPLGLAASSEPRAEVKEVLPDACEQLITDMTDHLSIFAETLRVASDYPAIISELAPAAAYGDNATLHRLLDRMNANEAKLVDLGDRQERLGLSDNIDTCAEYR